MYAEHMRHVLYMTSHKKYAEHALLTFDMQIVSSAYGIRGGSRMFRKGAPNLRAPQARSTDGGSGCPPPEQF